MPFGPVNMPGLGISTLKATLALRDVSTDLYYGALDFFRFFSDVAPCPVLRLDYDFIATNMDVGDLLFADALWQDDDHVIDDAISRLVAAPNLIFSPAQMAAMGTRLRAYARGISGFTDYCLARRDWSSYDVVGFSSTFAQNLASLALARRIRARHPEVGIVFGGANCDSTMGEQLIRSFAYIDAVVRGEADFTFPLFVERWRDRDALADVPGVVYRDAGQIVIGAPARPIDDMDSLPMPDFADFFAQLPDDFERRSGTVPISLPIETSRGCWWGAIKHCIFCGLNPTTMAFRRKSPARAVDEFRQLATRHQRTSFYAVDNIIDKKYFRSVLPELERDNLAIFYETKSNLAEWEVAQLARAGVRDVQPGIEGLNTAVLKLMAKGVKGYQNIELLKWCAIHDVGAIWFYLYGFPDEPERAFLDDAAMFYKLCHLPPPKNANPVLLDRFSPMFIERERFGITNVQAVPATRVAYRGLGDDEIFNLAYHFTMTLPDSRTASYADVLNHAILRWKYEYFRGARFYQFRGDELTLLLDTRRGELRSTLLSGVGARIYHRLREGMPLAALLAERGLFTDLRGDSMRDLTLIRVATELGAGFPQGPASADEVAPFLDQLVADDLVLALDNRYLALAIDCTKVAEATPFGLEDFVITAARLPPPPIRSESLRVLDDRGAFAKES